MSDRITFVHLTDLHVGDPSVKDDHLFSDTGTTLRTILQAVATVQPKPAFVVVSGDLTNRGDIASYRELRRLFDEAALDMPILWAIGNHDTRPGFYEGLLDRRTDVEAPYFHDRVIAGIHVIVLDTSIPGKPGGNIEPEQFDWLQDRLYAHPELRKLIVMHHAPALDFDNPSLEWESITFADTARLEEMLAPHHVLGIMSGHMHYDRVSDWNGIPVVVGVGQHAAMDVLYLHEGLRMVEGTSFAIGTIRPSGLTVAFAPQPATRRELMKISYADMPKLAQKFYEDTSAAEAAE